MFTMKNLTNKTNSIIAGGISGLTGYLGITKMLEYVNNKSIIVDKIISTETLIDNNSLETAKMIAGEIVGTIDPYVGLLGLTTSGACAALSLYYSIKNKS